ncbi:MAG: trp RNA-binding attenuation protein MtrB, partial [Christensenellaceae bacterium]
IGMTRGKDTRLQHTEKLTKGDVLVAQFTDNISAIKISGKAQIMTKHGQVESGE